ncbi:isochorismate synthase [Streptomyces sp. Edi2]|uniref:isochorismate synthase n=1 Tax=Streptomyces sp. Edi2 TaxID=3162528 RepID=UPI0033056310
MTVRRNCNLPDAPGPILVGGFTFAPQEGKHNDAHSLPDGRMTAPAVQLVDYPSGDTYLTVNLRIEPGTSATQALTDRFTLVDKLINGKFPHGGKVVNRQVVSKTEVPLGADFQKLVAQAVDEIRNGTFEMVVTARELQVRLGEDFDLLTAVESLRSSSLGATVFAAHTRNEGLKQCFLGATPEYLVRLKGDTVQTLGLAGSTPRGLDPEEDYALERELLANEKLRHENAVVTEMLSRALSDVCHRIEVAKEPTVLKLTNIQHLATHLSGQLASSPPLGILDLVAKLHPTPALGGYPRHAALNWLGQNEPINRGWFASPVGWVDGHGTGEFAVAIRSALVQGELASLYAGCAIVEGSEPDAEYEETSIKLRTMASALGCL